LATLLVLVLGQQTVSSGQGAWWRPIPMKLRRLRELKDQGRRHGAAAAMMSIP